MSKGAGYGAGGADPTTKQLQERLQQLGFHVPSDGKFGPQTEAAVKAFQARYGLEASGGVDAATVEVLQAPPDQTLAQVRAAKASAAATAGQTSASARKKATAAAKAKSTVRTARVRRSAQAAGQRRSAALKRQPGVAPGTTTTVSGVGHMGDATLHTGLGMQGSALPAVSNLQAALSSAGYKLTKDGRYGPQTEAAVKKLQRDYGLTADGIAGPATKALLLGLESAATAAKPKKKVSAKQKLLPGEVATLRTKPPHPPHGSRTAGSRMKLQAPPPKPATLKYSASDLLDPDLEEATGVGGNGVANTSTVAFGVGGEPSMSIKDARPEGEPLADLPIWDRLQKVDPAPNYEIPDADSYKPVPAPPANLTIPDGRAYFDQALTEAIAARKAAKDGRTFVRALARERLLRERLQEETYKESLHPRGRGGKWVEVLNQLKGLGVNKPTRIEGVQAMRLSTGHYAASMPSGEFVHHPDPEPVAHAIAGHVARQEELAGHAERALTDLSPEAAQHFTHDWAMRGDPGGEPERHEMYSQVYSQDPKGFVRDVFSQQMTPEGRTEAEQALGAARERDQRNKVAPYFDLSKPHEMVPIEKLRPTKVDPESSYQNAAKRMDTAARGGMAKRKPVTAQRSAGDRLLLVDGHATVEALKRKGITHVPAEVRPRASNLNPDTKREDVTEQQHLERAAIDAERQARAAGARNQQIAGAERLAMSRRDDARASQVSGSQRLGRWIATMDHPTQGLIEVPVSAASREGAAQSATFTVGGTLQSLRPHDDTARKIEKRSTR